MDIPEGWEALGLPGLDKHWVLQLVKAIYGLKQSPRQWHKKLDEILQLLGFTKIKSDSAIWVYRKEDVRIILPVYVDDMTIVAKSKSDVAHVIAELKKHFKLRDLGETSYLLGVAITRDRAQRSISLSQQTYIEDFLQKFGFQDLKGVSTPMDPGVKLSMDHCPKTDEDWEYMKDKPYAQLVGTLMYLAIATRPDIAKAVSVLSRFSAKPGKMHWLAAVHLCRYLTKTKALKLVLAPDLTTPELFTTFSDANHADKHDDGKSTSGMLVKIGSGAISWAARFQSIIALSTTEAEYVSAVSAGQELIWMRQFLAELGYDFDGPSLLCVDNKSAIQVARNPEHHGRMKHLDLRFYWLRDMVEKGLICVEYLQTEDMPADILTKPLSKQQVEHGVSLLGLRY